MKIGDKIFCIKYCQYISPLERTTVSFSEGKTYEILDISTEHTTYVKGDIQGYSLNKTLHPGLWFSTNRSVSQVFYLFENHFMTEVEMRDKKIDCVLN
jgi:hypothetical protein